MTNRKAEITVIERRMYATYHPCGLPYAIGGEIPHIRHLVEEVPRMPGVNVMIGHLALEINRDEKWVEVQERKTGEKKRISYNKLILATGSLPMKPPIPGVELDNVFTLRTMRDGEEILDALSRATKAVVVGGGPIGIEAASALRERGMEVTLVEMKSGVLPTMLDPDMAQIVVERLEQEGIRTLRSKPVVEITGEEKVQKVVVEGEEIPADMVVLAVGVKPDVELAQRAGLEFGPTKLIRVNERLQTSDPDIYAAGDCAESRCLLTGRPIRSQLATTAIRMGRVAGINAVGGDEVFPGVLNTVVTSAYGMEIASTGLTTETAKEGGFEVVSARVRVLSKPHYYPGARHIVIKLLADRKSRRLIGGQIIGDGAAERTNLVAFAIKYRAMVEDLVRMEYCYVPPVNDRIEPLVIAAEALSRKLG